MIRHALTRVIRTSCTCCAASDDGHGGAEEQQRESGQIAALFLDSKQSRLCTCDSCSLSSVVSRLTSHYEHGGCRYGSCACHTIANRLPRKQRILQDAACQLASRSPSPGPNACLLPWFQRPANIAEDDDTDVARVYRTRNSRPRSSPPSTSSLALSTKTSSIWRPRWAPTPTTPPTTTTTTSTLTIPAPSACATFAPQRRTSACASPKATTSSALTGRESGCACWSGSETRWISTRGCDE